MHFFSFLFITVALLTAIYFSCFTHYYYNTLSPSSSHEHRKCPDLNFKDCEKKSCTNETEERIIVCYFTNWAWYRKGTKFTPDSVDASLCTHVNYAFASLDNETLTIKSSDPWTDIDNKFFQRVVNLTAKGVKVLLSIGGWSNSAANVGWSRMFNNATARAVFISSVVQFIEYYNFSGLDVDYEYPACPQADRSAGTPSDAVNFNKLMSELKDAFNGKYLLTVTVSAGEAIIKQCYNMSELCHIPDWINVMTYEYHSSSEGVVGAIAPTCGTANSWGVYDTLVYLTRVANCPSNQLVLGVPFYGKSYTLANAANHEFGAKSTGAGDAGPYTKSAGTLAYYEICLNERSGWKTGWSETNNSYAWNGNQFVSFDSMKDMERKSCLINKYFDLKGAMLWALGYDDFTDSCGGGVYPLLTTLNRQLRCFESAPKATGIVH